MIVSNYFQCKQKKFVWLLYSLHGHLVGFTLRGNLWWGSFRNTEQNDPHPNNPNIHRTDTRLNNQMHRHKQDNEETKQTHPNNPNVLHRQNKADLATTIKTIKIFYIDKTIKKQSNRHPNKYWRNINPIETVKKGQRDKT